MPELNNSYYESRWTGDQIDTVIDFFTQNTDLITKTLPQVASEIERLDTRISGNAHNISGNTTKLNDYLPRSGGAMLDNATIVIPQPGNVTYQGAADYSVLRITPTSNSNGITGEYIPVFSVYSKIDSSKSITESFSCGATKDNTLSFRHLKNNVSTEMFCGTADGVLMGAAWNDYAEFRKSEESEAGRVICENGDGTLSRSQKRLQPGAEIISDTFGFAIGKTEECQTPVAVTGRVLAYPYEDWWTFEPGEAVCAGPNGTVSKMTRREIKKYPERIIGTVSELPTYEKWGKKEIPVNGRIWIRIK